MDVSVAWHVAIIGGTLAVCAPLLVYVAKQKIKHG